MIANLIFQPEFVKNAQAAERSPTLNCWTFYLYKRIYSEPENFIKILKNYFITGQHDYKTFFTLESFILRVAARKAFQKSMKNINIVNIEINNLEIRLASLKPIELFGNVTWYTNKNKYIHNPSNNVFQSLITQTIIETYNADGLFFDVGAHAGVYSVFAAKIGFNVIPSDCRTSYTCSTVIQKLYNYHFSKGLNLGLSQ